MNERRALTGAQPRRPQPCREAGTPALTYDPSIRSIIIPSICTWGVLFGFYCVTLVTFSENPDSAPQNITTPFRSLQHLTGMGNPGCVKRDFEALEKRRSEAMRLLDEGLNQPETARQLKAARQTVSAWRRRYLEPGPAALRRAGRAGRKPLPDAAQRERLTALLLEGPEAHGFPPPLRTCPRVARLIRDEFGVDHHEGRVWKILRGPGWSPQRPAGQGRERNEEAIRTGKCTTGPDLKKPEPKAAR